MCNRTGTGSPGASVGPVGRLYVSGGKVRIETPEAAAGFFLIDGETAAAVFVRPTQRLFMDAKQSTWLTQILVPLDPDAPCKQRDVPLLLAESLASGQSLP